MNNTNYQKTYKKQYSEKNKIVTFPLSNAFYDELKKRAFINDTKINSFAKTIITNHLNSSVPNIISKEKKELIQEYIRISRGIANNINQIAHKTNIEETIDISVLLNSLKNYEDEFKKYIFKA